jgi:hypothetical protein
VYCIGGRDVTLTRRVRMNNAIIKAMIDNGYLVSGDKVPTPKPKQAVESDLIDNYNKILDTPENPYYYIENDSLNDEFLGLEMYDKVTGKPIVNPLHETLRQRGIIWESTN